MSDSISRDWPEWQVESVFKAIESVEFSGEVIASGFSMFVRLVLRHPMVKQLEQHLHEAKVSIQVLYDRIKTLREQPNDPKYQHPNDLPIAVYLLLIRRYHETVEQQLLMNNPLQWNWVAGVVAWYES